MSEISDGRFGPGNPGRPKGSRHKVTLAIEALMEGEAEALTRKAIEKALAGDMVALKLCLDRIAPPRRDRLVNFTLPTMKTVADAPGAMAAILAAVAAGEITPAEGATCAGILGIYSKAVDSADHETRLLAVEEALDDR